MFKKKFKRIVAIICCLSMLLNVLNLVAYADDMTNVFDMEVMADGEYYDGDILDESEIESIELFSAVQVYLQGGGQSWSGYMYSNHGDTKQTIKSSGCALLALTNAVYHLNGNFINPTTLADFSMKNGYRSYDSGTYHSFFEGAAKYFGDQYNFYFIKNTSSISELKSNLQNGGTATCRKPGHFMAIVQYDASNDKYLLIDSAPDAGRGTSAGYAWKTASQLSKMGITNYFLLNAKSVEPMSISNIRYENVDDTGFTILCDIANASSVKFPTWREDQVGGQAKWKEGSYDGKTASCRINTSEWGSKNCIYNTHIYAYDKAGKQQCLAGAAIGWPDNDNPEISNVNITNISPDGYTITCEVTDGTNDISSITGFTWNDELGREAPYGSNPYGRTVGYTGTFNGKIATIRINTADFDGRTKGYTTHLWAYDKAGRSRSYGVNVTVPGLDTIPKKVMVSGNKVYSIFDLRQSWTNAKQLAEDKGGHLATLKTQEEQDVVKQLLEYGSMSQYWIGASDEVSEGNWTWVSGGNVDYSNWHQGEPNNDCGGIEHYAGIYSNGTWNDFMDETENIGYIMENTITGVPTVSVHNNGHYYYLYDNEIDWHSAKAFCETLGGHLVTINSGDEQELIYNLAKNGNSETAGYFIGASSNEDGSVWSWVTGETVDYSNWHSGEPNNTEGIEHYAEFYKSGLWNDRQSYNNGAKNGFILEIETDETYTAKTEYAGNTYVRIDKSLSWEDAKAYCESIGGHLATITDDEEQEAVEDLFVRGLDTLRSAYALGATDVDEEGSWKWVTDEEFDYDNWDAGEPNNGDGAGEQNYLSIYTTGSQFGLWDDNWNFNKNPYDTGFICEIEGEATEPTPTPDAGDVVIPEPDISTPEPEEPGDTPEIDETLSTITVETVNAEGGDTIIVPVNISNNQGICESKFVMQYDNTRLTPVKVNTGEAFTDGSLQTDIENMTEGKNTLTVTWENSSIADNLNDGVMFEVEFAVNENAAPGMIPVTIVSEQLEVINSNGEDININLVSGGVAIAWPVISVGNVKTHQGQTITVPVSIENNTGINAFGFTVEYDNVALTPREITVGEVIDGKGSIQSNLDDSSINWNEQNEVTATWLSDDLENNTTGDGVLFNIEFNVNSSTDVGFYPVKIKYIDGDITNADGAEIGVTTTSGGVAVEEIAVTYGDVNSDGKVNIIDIVLLRKYYANIPVEISEEGLLAADVNCDGDVNNKDILLMRKYVAKWQGITLGR